MYVTYRKYIHHLSLSLDPYRVFSYVEVGHFNPSRYRIKSCNHAVIVQIPFLILQSNRAPSRNT